MTNIKVGRYQDPQAVGYAGWIEDEEKTWIAFIDLEGKPTFWLNREDKGGVTNANPG